MTISALHITEKAFTQQVLQLFRMHGWLVYHTHDSRRSAPGFPDICAAHKKHGVIFAELKSERGKLSTHQQKWLLALRSNPTYTWRPADWNEIIEVARRGPI